MYALIGCTDEDPIRVTELSVMTYNVLWNTSNDATLKVIQETGADIIGLPELSDDRGNALAASLGYHYTRFDKTTGNLSANDTGILSRYPILETLPNGVVIQVDETLKVAIFSVHLTPYPYEPYDIRDQKISTASEAIASAANTRIPEISPVLNEIKSLQNRDFPIFLVGDFNEPSHLDWTTATATAQMHFGMVVEWPVSKLVEDNGLVDTYRSVHPDPVADPGITWTPWVSPNEIYDRIDIIYDNDHGRISLSNSKLVGGLDTSADIKVEGYPSDHFAVVSTYDIGK